MENNELSSLTAIFPSTGKNLSLLVTIERSSGIQQRANTDQCVDIIAEQIKHLLLVVLEDYKKTCENAAYQNSINPNAGGSEEFIEIPKYPTCAETLEGIIEELKYLKKLL